MVRIKTTNVVKDEEVKTIVRTVQCPTCKTFLKGIELNVIVMRCWYCEGEFKIQQDPDKHDCNVEPVRLERTISGPKDLTTLSPGLH